MPDTRCEGSIYYLYTSSCKVLLYKITIIRITSFLLFLHSTLNLFIIYDGEYIDFTPHIYIYIYRYIKLWSWRSALYLPLLSVRRIKWDRWSVGISRMRRNHHICFLKNIITFFVFCTYTNYTVIAPIINASFSVWKIQTKIWGNSLWESTFIVHLYCVQFDNHHTQYTTLLPNIWNTRRKRNHIYIGQQNTCRVSKDQEEPQRNTAVKETRLHKPTTSRQNIRNFYVYTFNFNDL
jgi:hypothetical protein